MTDLLTGQSIPLCRACRRRLSAGKRTALRLQDLDKEGAYQLGDLLLRVESIHKLTTAVTDDLHGLVKRLTQ